MIFGALCQILWENSSPSKSKSPRWLIFVSSIHQNNPLLEVAKAAKPEGDALERLDFVVHALHAAVGVGRVQCQADRSLFGGKKLELFHKGLGQ